MPRSRSRRLACAYGAALLLAPLAATGCSGGADDRKPTAGGTLTFATQTEPSCLDPAASPQEAAALIDRNIFDTLVVQDRSGNIHPSLASWKVSKDGRTYTFSLRKGVTFHDGTPLDASAVKASLDHVVDPKTKSFLAASLISAYLRSTVVNASTLKVELRQPDAPFLQALSTAFLGIQSPKSLRAGPASVCAHPVGTGPFVFAGWSRSTSVRLKRNPAYRWAPSLAGRNGPARLAGLTFSFVPEDSARIGALTSGQVQAASNVPPNRIDQLSSSGSVKVEQYQAPGTANTVFLNPRRAPLSDEKVRIALQRSVNLDTLVSSVYFRKFARAWSVLTPSTADYAASVKGSWPYDPALANRLLDQAGWTGRDSAGYRTKAGKRLTVRWPYAAKFTTAQDAILGQGIQADAKKVGIDVQFDLEDLGALQKDIVNGANADLYSTSYVRAEPDILRYFFGSDQTAAKGGGNAFLIKDATLDGWLNSALTSTDPAKRRELYGDVQKYVLQHALALPTYVPAYVAGVSTRVHGLTFDPQAYPLFYDAWLGAGE